MEDGGGRGALEALYSVSEGLMCPMVQQGLMMMMTAAIPVLAGNLLFSVNISSLPFSLNILPVFEILPSQRKIMFSLFNQSFSTILCHFSVVSQPFLPL